MHPQSSSRSRSRLRSRSRNFLKVGAGAEKNSFGSATLAFNVNNCKVMHVGRGHQGYKYTMEGQLLQETECERDIGVNIDKWDHQCNALKLLRLLQVYWRKYHKCSPWGQKDIDGSVQDFFATTPRICCAGLVSLKSLRHILRGKDPRKSCKWTLRQNIWGATYRTGNRICRDETDEAGSFSDLQDTEGNREC